MGLAIGPATASAQLQVAAADLPGIGHTLRAQDPLPETNDVAVSYTGTTWTITDAAAIGSMPPQCSKVAQSSLTISCDASSFQVLIFELGAGNDGLAMVGPYHGAGIPNKFVDVIVTLGDGADEFSAENGAGTELVNGGRGQDNLLGGPMLDRFIGGPGADLLAGNGGTDDLFGRGGPDHLFGGAGRTDLMVGGTGKDRCAGQRFDLVAGCEIVKVHK
jgi:Ca2+-binding RTX toxin-like protein